jgi:hemoglobin
VIKQKLLKSVIYKKETMELQINAYLLGQRPNVTRPDTELLTVLGEQGVRNMVSKHYDLLSVSEIKHLFPPSAEGLEHSKKNSADFMVQILGGPEYFNNNRGKPRLADRHKTFSITPEGRIVWLNCYKQVLFEMTDVPENLIISFWDYLNVFSNWMVNTPNN